MLNLEVISKAIKFDKIANILKLNKNRNKKQSLL